MDTAPIRIYPCRPACFDDDVTQHEPQDYCWHRAHAPIADSERLAVVLIRQVAALRLPDSGASGVAGRRPVISPNGFPHFKMGFRAGR
jgi:hypothetical protein